MNNIYEFPRQDQRYDEASIWIAKLDNELWAADRDALRKWMAADQENQTVLLNMAELWDNMSVLSRLSELFFHGAFTDIHFPGNFALRTSVDLFQHECPSTLLNLNGQSMRHLIGSPRSRNFASFVMP